MLRDRGGALLGMITMICTMSAMMDTDSHLTGIKRKRHLNSPMRERQETPTVDVVPLKIPGANEVDREPAVRPPDVGSVSRPYASLTAEAAGSSSFKVSIDQADLQRKLLDTTDDLRPWSLGGKIAVVMTAGVVCAALGVGGYFIYEKLRPVPQDNGDELPPVEQGAPEEAPSENH